MGDEGKVVKLVPPLDSMEHESLGDYIRRVVRTEIASLAGLGLRRSQDPNYSRDPDRNLAMEVVREELAVFWGEALSDFSGHTGGGQAPGEPHVDLKPDDGT